MKEKIIVALICSFFLCTLLTGCGGGGAKLESTVSTQTLGQQLIDLDKAHKDGVITDKEYETSKKNLINKYK